MRCERSTCDACAPAPSAAMPTTAAARRHWRPGRRVRRQDSQRVHGARGRRHAWDRRRRKECRGGPSPCPGIPIGRFFEAKRRANSVFEDRCRMSMPFPPGRVRCDGSSHSKMRSSASPRRRAYRSTDSRQKKRSKNMGRQVRTDESPSGKLTVYYDGACPLCRREIEFYRRRRGADAIEWVDAAVGDARSCCRPISEASSFQSAIPQGY